MVIGFGQFALFPYLRLIKNGSTATGTVVARDPANHDTVAVRFSVNGGEYLVSSSRVAKPNSEKSALTAGSSVVVYYLPDAPDTATLGDPRQLLQNEAVPVGLAAVLFPTLLVLSVVWRTRRRPVGQP
jgi:hypothetical protein